MTTDNFKEMPLVTIVIPSYNHAPFVQECIQSVLDQDYENIELIIIDDGSTDNSVLMIEEMVPLCQERFKRFEFRSRSNVGLCATLNEAIKWAKGIYFSPSASDDILFANKISSQVKTFQKFGDVISGLFCGVEIFNNRSGQTIKYEKGIGGLISFEDVLTKTKPLIGSTPMLALSRVNEVGGYEPKFVAEDLYMYLKLTEDGSYLYSMSDVLIKYRRHDVDLVSKTNKVLLDGTRRILAQYKDHPRYKEALANTMIIQAHSVYSLSFKESFGALFEAVKIYPRVVFFRGFFTLIAKYVLPKKIVKFLKRI